MRLITITFLVLLCDFFGTIATDLNNDINVITNYDVETSKSDLSGLFDSCIFGTHAVSIVLFTSNIPQGQVIKNINESCSSFDTSKKVFFMTHGFLANSYNYNFSDFASLLIKADYTVFSLDWSDGACYNDPRVINLLEYPFAVKNTREVGEYLASYAKAIIKTCGVPLKDITFMGHSLGAHISSFAAKDLQKSKDFGEAPLLIGTDPAAPLFMLQTCNTRFCKTDAKYVIAFHTSALGIQKSIAHLDLWFNNGSNQPACGGLITGSMLVNCSHNVAILYLADLLLDNCVYVGVPVSSRMIQLPQLLPGCSSNRANCIVVDKRLIYNNNYDIVGDFCVSVSSKYPYCTKNNFSCQGRTANTYSIL